METFLLKFCSPKWDSLIALQRGILNVQKIAHTKEKPSTTNCKAIMAKERAKGNIRVGQFQVCYLQVTIHLGILKIAKGPRRIDVNGAIYWWTSGERPYVSSKSEQF